MRSGLTTKFAMISWQGETRNAGFISERKSNQ